MSDDAVSPPPAPQGGLCPSCGRYVGPAPRCHYCGADAPRAQLTRALRLGALALGLVGLVLLYLMAYRSRVPIVQVGDITPMMNFGHVRVAGVVQRHPYTARDGNEIDYASFVVRDQTGELRVTAYRSVAQALHASGRLPAKGAFVDVTGSLSVASDGQVKLRLQAAEHLRIRDASAAEAVGGHD